MPKPRAKSNYRHREAPKVPELGTDDEEIIRLMKRPLSDVPYHPYIRYLYGIPAGVTQLPCNYDDVCCRCGKIGAAGCCQDGSYAVYKRCYFCSSSSHWFWENKCLNDRISTAPHIVSDVDYMNGLRNSLLSSEIKAGENLKHKFPMEHHHNELIRNTRELSI